MQRKGEVYYRCTMYFLEALLPRTNLNLLLFVALRNLSEFLLYLFKSGGYFEAKLLKNCEVQRNQGSLISLHNALFRGSLNLN